MIIERINMEHEYYSDMILRNGFKIENEDTYSPVDPQALVNSSKFTDCEFRCDCGAFIGQDIIGQKCPICGSEIMLHSLNFRSLARGLKAVVRQAAVCRVHPGEDVLLRVASQLIEGGSHDSEIVLDYLQCALGIFFVGQRAQERGSVVDPRPLVSRSSGCIVTAADCVQ